MSEEKQGRGSITNLLPKEDATRMVDKINIRIQQAEKITDDMKAELKQLNAELRIYSGIVSYHEGVFEK